MPRQEAPERPPGPFGSAQLRRQPGPAAATRGPDVFGCRCEEEFKISRREQVRGVSRLESLSPKTLNTHWILNQPFLNQNLFCGLNRHRWTGRYEAHLWDKQSWSVTQRKKGKQGMFQNLLIHMNSSLFLFQE